jgi:hypothetical protein
MNNIRRPRCKQAALWAASLLALAFALSQPDSVVAQTQWIPSGDNLYNSPLTGKVGIGTSSPGAQLHITQQLRIDGTDGAGGYRAIGFGGNAVNTNPTIYSNGAYLVMNGAWGSTLFLNWDNGIGSSTNIQANGGKVGIGTASPSTTLHVVGTATMTGATSTGALTVNGDVNATGIINAKYQDLAEWVPATRAILAGTVVVLDADQSNHVLPSTRSYDTRVAGVVSAKPGVLLGEGGEGKVMVATTGRVRVKVDATLAPIRVGDLLVTSDKEGIAMRSEPLDLGGTPIHRPGTLIGKALEPLDKGTGEILVLLSLQ